MSLSSLHKLILSVFLRRKPNLDFLEGKQKPAGILKATLLFELGSMQAYHYQTEEEASLNKHPTSVYWSDRTMMLSRGPFSAIHLAMEDYTAIVSLRKADRAPDNLIRVDFKTRKRING